MTRQHTPRAALAPWTFGYKPGTTTTCLRCGLQLVYVCGVKRHYWRHVA